MKIFKSNKKRDEVFDSYDELIKTLSGKIVEKDILTYYGKAHCIILGKKENPPLIFFHGAGNNSAASWIPNIKELSNHFYCIAIDIIGGSGKSTCNENYNNEFNPERWINEIFDKLEIRDINIVGHSNGAYLAYWYIKRQPDRINKAIFLDSVGIKSSNSKMKAIFNILKLLFPEILFPLKKNIIKIVKKMLNPGSDVINKYPKIVDHLMLIMKNYNNRAMLFHKRENYVENESESIKDKMLFIFGEREIFGKSEAINILKRDKFNIKIIPKTCHLINYEKPEVINDDIYQFIKNKGI
jgi:pimeloyl-ACP methyl ester carboxylesterase